MVEDEDPASMLVMSPPPTLGSKKSTFARAMSYVSEHTPKLARPALSSRTSVNVRRTHADVRGAIEGTRGGLSTFGATYTVVNTFVGLGLLSKPYAIQQGGILSILWLALICLCANYSGKVIIRCFAHPNVSGSHQDYPALGMMALGKKGMWTVRVFVVLEFVGSCVTCLVLLARNLYLLTRAIDGLGEMTDENRVQYKMWLFLGCLVTVTPTVWMLNFGELWFLSLLGSTCSCLVSATVIGCFVKAVVENKEVDASSLDVTGDPNDTMVALGIFILSMAGHAALPGVYSQMQRPQDFNRMLDVSFSAIFLVYATVALSGYWTYGSSVQVVVTDNLREWPGGFAFYLVTVFVCVQIWSCISGCVQILCEIPEDLMFGESLSAAESFDDDENDSVYRTLGSHDGDEEEKTDGLERIASTGRMRTISSPPPLSTRQRTVLFSSFWTVPNKQRLFRTCVLWCLIGPASFLCYGNLRLALVEAVTGAFCTMMTSLVLPAAILCALFTVRPNANDEDKEEAPSPMHVSRFSWFFNASLVIFGVIFGAYMTYGDFSTTLE